MSTLAHNFYPIIQRAFLPSKRYIKAVNPRLQAEVSPDDIVQAGVIISNSEVGLGSVSIQPLIYRLVCSNGMVVNEAAARRNHVGRVTDSEENFSVYSSSNKMSIVF